MPLDILDDDVTWNLARIVRVSREDDKCYVTVRYEGWGSKWDVELPYPNERLARVFTFTRQVKGFVSLLGSNKVDIGDKSSIPGHLLLNNSDNWTDAWPCKVSFRMPHHNRESACDVLRTEDKVYVQPYMAYALPGSVQHHMTHGGQWVDTSRLLPWKDLDVDNNSVNIPKRICILQEMTSSRGQTVGNDPALSSSQGIKFYYFIKAFCDAYRMAQSDWIQGRLPPQALSKGALLKDEYRTFPDDLGGDPTDGFQYSGSLTPRKWASDNANRNVATNHSLNHPRHREAPKIAFAPVPSLPPPIPVTEKAYFHQGVRRLEVSNRWAGVLHVAGNDLFVGSYASQSEAHRAVRLASAQSRRENCQGVATGAKHGQRDSSGLKFEDRTPHLTRFPEFDVDSSLFAPNAARLADLFNTPAESVVSAFEETQQLMSGDDRLSLEHEFRLREWIGQHYSHGQHLQELALKSGEDILSNTYILAVSVKYDGKIGNKRRKLSHPKRLQQHLSLIDGKRSNND
jgi:hypothetical protein